MTSTFRDPIIYPGAPLEPAVGKWGRVGRRHQCALGREWMQPDTIGRWTGTGWECRRHAHPEWGPDTP